MVTISEKRTWMFSAKCRHFLIILSEVVGGFLDPFGLPLQFHSLPLLPVLLRGRLTVKVRLAGVRIHLEGKQEQFQGLRNRVGGLMG